MVADVKRRSIAISSSCIQETVLHPSDKDNVGALVVCGTEADVSSHGRKGGMFRYEPFRAVRLSTVVKRHHADQGLG
jgi:hypothetical protein